MQPLVKHPSGFLNPSRMNLTDKLEGVANPNLEEDDAMEEMEIVMLKLDNAFQAYKDPARNRYHGSHAVPPVGAIVGEIGD